MKILIPTLLLTLASALGSATPKSQLVLQAENNIACLAKNIYHEARGEPYAGQLAVAYTTLNRVEHKAFSNTICAVVFEKGQFSWTSDKNKVKQKVPKKYYQLARLAISKHKRVKFNALYFHNTSINPKWKHKKLAKIGNHVFYL